MFQRLLLSVSLLVIAGCSGDGEGDASQQTIFSNADQYTMARATESVGAVRQKYCRQIVRPHFDLDDRRAAERQMALCLYGWISISIVSSQSPRLDRDLLYPIAAKIEHGHLIDQATIDVTAIVRTPNGDDTVPVGYTGGRVYRGSWYDAGYQACGDDPIELEFIVHAKTVSNLLPGEYTPAIPVRKARTVALDFSGGFLGISSFSAAEVGVDAEGDYRASINVQHYIKDRDVDINTVHLICIDPDTTEFHNCNLANNDPLIDLRTYPGWPTTLSCGDAFYVMPKCNLPNIGSAVVAITTSEGTRWADAYCNLDTGG